jgi:hypothetical protein
VRFHRWELGFRQCGFRPIARVSRDGTFSAFQWLPLLWHALFPSSFRSQVNQMTQEHSSGFLLTASGIQHRVPRRTLSISSGSPVVYALTPRTVSAFRISRTLTSGWSDHLSPFALWPAFPTSDYCGDSVTVGLAPVRPSRVPLVLNVSSVT